jgi:hypothetical protein
VKHHWVVCQLKVLGELGHRIDYTEASLVGFSYDFPMILA